MGVKDKKLTQEEERYAKAEDLLISWAEPLQDWDKLERLLREKRDIRDWGFASGEVYL